MRLADARPDDKGGFFLSVDGKTGPRTIYVMESAPAIRIWGEYHPQAGNESAPFFPGRTPDKSIAQSLAGQILDRLAEAADVRYPHPHLFRHTRATRAAKSDRVRGISPWNESEMRGYFGWEPGSKMPSYYTHLAMADMEERVRADAGADPLAAAIRQDPLRWPHTSRP